MKMKPISEIKLDLGINPNGRVQRFMTDACYRRMDKYVPYRGGANRNHLRDNIFQGIDYIIYKQPYAHAQYVGYTKGPVRHYSTPNTWPYWDKKMISIEKDDLIQEIQNEVNKNANR